MVFSSSGIRMLTPLMRSMIATNARAGARPACSIMSNVEPAMAAGLTKLFTGQQAVRRLGSNVQFDDKQMSLPNLLDREIQEETAELNQRLQSDQFPGFSVETDDADVKLTKQVGDTTVVVRFTVSSSLNEWRTPGTEAKQNQEDQVASYSLLSLPDFQVQISRDNKTLEVSCFFEELEHDEETGEPFAMEPTFNIDELVMYEGEPRETEFSVSTEFFREELQDGIHQYLVDHGIDEEFVKNLVSYSTNYEKKQYIGLMTRLRDFVSK